MAKKGTRIKRVVFPVPKNREEAAEFLAQIGEKQRKITEIESALNNEVKALQAKAMAETKPYEEEVFRLFSGIFAFAQAHRAELTKDGKRKTIPLPTGRFGWRLTPPAVSIDDPDSVVAELKSRGLKRWIITITKELPNKKEMLKEPEKAMEIPGVTISQQEMFAVTPAELKVKIESDVEKLKRAAS